MSELAHVVVSRDGLSMTAVVTGEIDASNAEEVRAQLESAAVPPKLTVDLSGLEYLDSAGVRALFKVAESALTRSTELRLVVRDGSPIRRVLDVVGVETVARVDSGV